MSSMLRPRRVTTFGPATDELRRAVAEAPALRRVPRPPASAVVFAAVLLSLVLRLGWMLLNSDGELVRHLVAGEFMLRHRGLLSTYPFTFTSGARPFVGFEYGSQLAYALAHRAGGLAGVSALAMLLIATTYALLADTLVRRRVDPTLAVLAAGLGAVLGKWHWVARPHLFTLVAVVLLVRLVEGERRRALWALPLFAAWANFHGGWLYGLVVLGLYLAGSAAESLLSQGDARRAWRRDTAFFARALGLAVLGTCLTPHGLRLYPYLAELFSQPYLFDHTIEFLSPDFHDPASKPMLWGLLAIIAALALGGRRMTIPRVLVVTSHTAAMLTAVRNAELLGITGVAVVALHVDPAWRSVGAGSATRLTTALASARDALSRWLSGGRAMLWCAPAAALLLLAGMRQGQLFGRTVLQSRVDPHRFPVAAVAAARATGADTRVYASTLSWSGYIEYAWPEARLFIDGSTDFHGTALMKEYRFLKQLRPGWRASLDRWRVGTVITGRTTGLARTLANTAGWRVAHCDADAVLLVRDPAAPGVAPADCPLAGVE